MESYIEKMVDDLEKLGMVLIKKEVSVPLTEPIDGDSQPLTPKLKRLYLTANGCLAWCSNTVRIDCSFPHSRIGQHSANPTISGLNALIHSVSYLYQHKHWCLSQTLYPEDDDIRDVLTQHPTNDQMGFRLYSDTDHAGNAEVQNKRRSQNGYVAMNGEAAIDWHSKVSSVAFATSRIGEAHPDFSSGAVEIYGTANATHSILDLSYLYEESGMEFPFPFELLMDNTTAEAFCKGTVKRSKLKYIDCRQEWVRTLRDKKVMSTLMCLVGPG
jgi:hypothetical protein